MARYGRSWRAFGGVCVWRVGGGVTSRGRRPQRFLLGFGTRGQIVIDGSFDGGIRVFDKERPAGVAAAEPQGWGTSYIRQVRLGAVPLDTRKLQNLSAPPRVWR